MLQSLPLVHYFAEAPTIEEAATAFEHLPGLLVLDSSLSSVGPDGSSLGRYSFLMADPFEWVVADAAECRSRGAHNPLARVRDLIAKFRCDCVAGLPPMQGGVAGLLSYEFHQAFEAVPVPAQDPMPVPPMVFAAYDCVLAWDHDTDKCCLISQGFPETDPGRRKAHALSRQREFLDRLGCSQESECSFEARAELTPENPPNRRAKPPSPLKSNFSRSEYTWAVKKCIDYIYSGDVFQVNLAQTLRLSPHGTAMQYWRSLRRCNPSPFGCYFKFDVPGFAATEIVSASPERLALVRAGVVQTRPIKGTRRRTGKPIVDLYAREQLLNSVKDVAENTMIVDLMRNDLSRVCEDDSVIVRQFCEPENYASVVHLVSSVEGKLAGDQTAIDLVTAIYPGGSITGAPKIRAMEIIAEVEPETRGAYCGSIGYFGFDGNADFNILIRTLTAQQGQWKIPVGGGIVSQSDPEQEYAETWTKAAGMLQAAGIFDEAHGEHHAVAQTAPGSDEDSDPNTSGAIS